MSDSRTTLKTYFNTGDKPTEAQFSNFIDGVPNCNDDLGSYKESIFYLSFTGTSAPSTIFSSDKIGITSITRDSIGVFKINSSAKFTGSKTFFLPAYFSFVDDNDNIYHCKIQYNSTSVIDMFFFDDAMSAADPEFAYFMLMLRVYS